MESLWSRMKNVMYDFVKSLYINDFIGERFYIWCRKKL